MKFTFTEKKMGSSADLRAYAERKVGKLDLSDNPITDASPLYGLSSLRELYISGTSLTPDQIAELEAKLPDCTVYVM